jgi:S-formylglutathione hydrolase
MVKAGAQSWAAQHDVALIFPDTSPRGVGVADDEAFDLGQGAGFYVNATQAPWAPHFKMWDYIAEELPSVMDSSFPIDMSRQSISGHSMGGHGALTLALRQPGRFKSVSAFAPICNPMKSDWGIKQFTAYLGEDKGLWAAHDASQLMAEHGFDGPILIDNGSEDPFLEKLRPEAFADAVAARGHNAQFRLQPGYDHSYFFISTFMQEHIAFHADYLR